MLNPPAYPATHPLRLPGRIAFCLAAAAMLLQACGGSAPDSVVPIVTSATAGPTGAEGTGTYGKKVIITINGTSLDKGITVLSNTCSGITRLTAAPTESTATTAYYECTVVGAGSLSAVIVRDSSGISLATAAFTVPTPQVTLTIGNGTSSLGNVVITLSPTQAPVTVNNFISYINSGFYVGTVFHRVSPNFVIQGGGYSSPLDPASSTTPTLKTTNTAIALEDNTGLSNLRWTVSMARTNAANSATSQFFINLKDNTGLDLNLSTGERGYAVFGTVTAGTDVVTAMTAAPCVSYNAILPAGDCLPLPNLVITAATQTR